VEDSGPYTGSLLLPAPPLSLGALLLAELFLLLAVSMMGEGGKTSGGRRNGEYSSVEAGE